MAATVEHANMMNMGVSEDGQEETELVGPLPLNTLEV